MLFLLLRKLHKWLGLIIGLQLVLWAVSGVMFAWLDRDAVDGTDSVHAAEPAVLSPSLVKADPGTWLGNYPAQDLYDLRAVSLADRWVWRVELRDRVELRAIEDGSPVKVDEEWLRRLALDRYAGSGKLIGATLQTQPDIASRARGPVWQAQFDDPPRTAMYFAADDGHFIAARTAAWRWYDFFWMLHTMDYRGRDDFNNPLIVVIGFAALWLSISGVLLLTRSFR